MIRVGVNGYGTIGKRVADAVDRQPDMAVAGVAKTRPNFEATAAVRRGYDLYAAQRDPGRFADAGVPVAGPLADLVAASDVVVDATPAGVGAEYRDLYRDHDTPAVFQGGEAAAVAETSFNARANFAAAAGADAVRVVSCNTTGLCRLLAPLEERYGVVDVGATLIRRGGDPAQPDRGPIDDILPDPVEIPSHHGPDVQTIFPGIDVQTMGVRVPATLMHLHGVRVRLEATPSVAEVRSLLRGESRVALVVEEWAIDGCGALREFARDVGRPRGDLWENCVWEESLAVRGNELSCFQAIHQESDVVPENVDAVRALRGSVDARESMARTDEALGVGFAADRGRRLAAGAE